MAITDKNTIYSWFQTDDFPTEAQFRATWDSFWHKSESIPMSQITGLNELFIQTASLEGGLTTKLDKGAYTGNASDLVPYNGATQDVNIASNYFKTSKGFDFKYDENNYFKTYYSSSYNHLGFYSKDSSNDNFGYMFIEASPEIGFVVNIAKDDGIYNSFHATESRTYSEKPFVSNEGFIKTGGTATQALTANGDTFDLTTKLDKGTYAGNAQDLKNDIDTKQKKLSSFDESILIEPDGNIEGNVSLFTEYFNQQVCELNFIPTQIIGVYVNGIKQRPSSYVITLPKTIKIVNFTSGDYIEIQYTHLKS